MGNTCYMAAGLQCLSNIPSFREYFLSDQFSSDINRENPLGWRGRVAEEFAALLKAVWSSQLYQSVRPSAFKQMLGRLNAQFDGWEQQDCQEFLAFLMDGLHEDLNRVKVKPLTDAVDRNDFESDAAAAAEARRRHALRNDSRVGAEFQGMYKSTVVCEECHLE